MEDALLKYKSLIELTHTTDDINILDQEMDLLTKSLYNIGESSFKETMERYLRVRSAFEIDRLIQLYSNGNKNEIKSILTQAYRTVCSMPVLRVALSIEPSQFLVGTISAWARANLSEGIILDLSVDRHIIGGIILDYEGKLYDYSLRKSLDSIFEKGDFGS